jgi:hypothetical protein
MSYEDERVPIVLVIVTVFICSMFLTTFVAFLAGSQLKDVQRRVGTIESRCVKWTMMTTKTMTASTTARGVTDRKLLTRYAAAPVTDHAGTRMMNCAMRTQTRLMLRSWKG